MTGYMGYIGSASVLTGMWFIGRKWRFGFLLGALGEVFWFTRGYQAHEMDLMALAVVFTAMNLWNWIKWGRKANGNHILLFSKRRKLADGVRDWNTKYKGDGSIECVLAALQHLGVDLRCPTTEEK